MFDNLNNKTGPASQAPVEDIFSTVETAPRVNNGSGAAAPATEFSPAIPWETSTFSKKWLWLILVALLLVAGGAAAYYWWWPSANQPEAKVAAPAALVNPSTDNSSTVTPAPQPEPDTAKDSDGDGLTDDEERALGADPYLVDTDKDGLTDREEVKIYKTNPLNPDTDGDGYLDGEEVKNGYNPLGPGKLLQLPTNTNQ